VAYPFPSPPFTAGASPGGEGAKPGVHANSSKKPGILFKGHRETSVPPGATDLEVRRDSSIPLKEVKQMTRERLLRPREVARELAVSRSTIYRWFWEGKLKGVRLDGGTVRILESSVREKLADMD
jgi:excisionase family DNA binding protein